MTHDHVFKRHDARDLALPATCPSINAKNLAAKSAQFWADLMQRPLRWANEPHFTAVVGNNIAPENLLAAIHPKAAICADWLATQPLTTIT